VRRAQKLFKLASLVDDNGMAGRLAGLPSAAGPFEQYIRSNADGKMVTSGARVAIFQSGDPQFDMHSVFFGPDGAMNPGVKPVLNMARRLQKIRAWITFFDAWHLLADHEGLKGMVMAHIQRRRDAGRPIPDDESEVETSDRVSPTVASANRSRIVESGDFTFHDVFFNADGTKNVPMWNLISNVRRAYYERYPSSRKIKKQKC
jgi:hypothetical protein